MSTTPTVGAPSRHRVRRRAIAPVLIALAAGAGLVACDPVPTNPEACRGTIGAVTVEDVKVPSGATCTLNGTRVRGNVSIARNGNLRATRIVVDGNVQSQAHGVVTLRQSSRIGGSVQLENGGEIQVADSRVGGSIQAKANRGDVGVARNVVGSDIQLFTNRGGVLVRTNRVDGNLQCKSNAPAPTGGGNVVQGNKEDQCARL